MMQWVAKLQLAWCLQGPRGFSTTAAPDGIVHHQSAARAVTTGTGLAPAAQIARSRKKKKKLKAFISAGLEQECV